MTAFEEAVRYFGSQMKMADALNVSPMSVTGWKQKGVPLLRAFQIELATGRRITAKELCPEVYGATRVDDPIFTRAVS